LDRNTQGARRHDHPKETWKRTIEDEAMEAGKTWSEVKRLAVDRTQWRRFMDTLCSRGSLTASDIFMNILSTLKSFYS
jgi:hypothetical protein